MYSRRSACITLVISPLVSLMEDQVRQGGQIRTGYTTFAVDHDDGFFSVAWDCLNFLQ